MTRAERLLAADPVARIAAIAELAEGGAADPAELDALAECLGDAQKAVQRPAAEAFAALGARGVPVGLALERALSSPLERRRWGAAFALSLLGDPPAAALPAILEALGSDDGDVRWAAAAILTRLRDRAALVERLKELVAAGTPARRKMALYCLRDLDVRSPAVEELVLCALGDDVWDVRLAAVSTLARLSIDREAVAARLVGVLEGDDERMQRAAAAALGTLGERSDAVLAALRRASASEDASLARAAAAALTRLGGGE